MTDNRIEKIRAEIERLYNQSLADENRQADRGLECAANVSFGKSKACKELLSFIDSLQEEPKPKFKIGDCIKPIESSLGSPRTICEVCDSWYVTNQGTLDFEFEDNWELAEEPVSEEWIEELRTKLDSLSKEDFKKVFNKYVVDFNEEPVSEELEKVVEEIVDPTVLNAYGVKEIANRLRRTMIEPVSEDLEEAANEIVNKAIPPLAVKYKDGTYVGRIRDCFDRKEFIDLVKAGAEWQKTKDESTTENLGEYINELSKQFPEVSFAKLSRIAVRIAKWQKQHLWKPADGKDLPDIGREVIVLIKDSVQRNIHAKEYLIYRIGFGHRPNPDGWYGKNIDTNEVTHYTPKLYDNGGWNAPNIAYWLDIELPKEIEL